jgi:hypothetical protein
MATVITHANLEVLYVDGIFVNLSVNRVSSNCLWGFFFFKSAVLLRNKVLLIMLDLK